ncbi:MAG: phosphatidate cytidylyltransferase [Terrimicrobiaceae bacterium]
MFNHPLTLPLLLGVGILLALVPPIFLLASRRVTAKLNSELWARYFSWLWLVPLILLPVLLGRLATIAAFGILSLFCYREFARATGFFRERLVSAVVVLGILLLTAAAADHWYNFFMALPSLVVSLIVILALVRDQPSGYIQRVAMGVLAFLLFGVGLGHMSYFANDRNFQPLLLSIILCVELNDVLAFTCGKLFGKRKLCPGTSPNKTLGGSLGALVLTTAIFALLGSQLFAGTVLASPRHLITMGVLLSLTGQLGDLVVSSIKRDLGIKDMGASIPGHGGLLDRFDSLLFVGPALFHYIGYYLGVGLDQPARVFF